jgi:hypothetical protein
MAIQLAARACPSAAVVDRIEVTSYVPLSPDRERSRPRATFAG